MGLFPQPVYQISKKQVQEETQLLCSLFCDFSEFTLASVVRPPVHEQERQREANTDGMPGLCLCFLYLLL